MSLDKTTQVIPAGSEHLFDLTSHREGMQNKDIDAIISEACARDREQHFKRKVTAFKLREATHGEQDKTNQAKVDERLKLHGLFLDTASVLCGVGAAISGQTMVGGLMQVAQQAFTKTSDHKKEQTHATMTVFEHRYNRQGSIGQDHGQQLQSTDREWDQTATMIDRLMQAQQRTAELILSSGG